MRIALFGDRSSQPSHRELDALVPRLQEELHVHAAWVATDSGADVTAFDGIWLVTGSPYADDGAALAALTVARERGIPMLGTPAPFIGMHCCSYVATLFQPHLGASTGAPLHPLIRRFVAALPRP